MTTMFFAIRDGNIKMHMPNPIIKNNGEVWFCGNPIIDSQSETYKANPDIIKNAQKTKNWDKIPTDAIAHAGINPSGLEIITSDEWLKRNKIRLDNSVPGLQIIKNAYNKIKQYHIDFDSMMDDENNDGINPPNKPNVNIKDLQNQYPIATAYIKAEQWENSAHYVKSNAGKNAKIAIENGENYIDVLKNMEHEWTNFCMNNVD
jgi:hypothetical protein